MDVNLIGKRIFLLFGLLVLGAVLLFSYAGKVLAPLAVTLLPTETAEAHYARSAGYYVQRSDGESRQTWIPIDFAGETATLTMKTPAKPRTRVALINPDDPPNRPEPDPLAFLKPKPPPEPEKVFPVRFVRMFPSTVVLERPNSSLGSYYAELWTIGDVIMCFLTSCAFAVLALLFYRHLRGLPLPARWENVIRMVLWRALRKFVRS